MSAASGLTPGEPGPQRHAAGALGVRGRETSLAAVPRHWRGPLPDVSVQRHLPPLDGYAKIPADLVFSRSTPDLGVVLWALLTLRGGGQQAIRATYPEFAEALGISTIRRAHEGRLTAAIKALEEGGWIRRARMDDNSHTYMPLTPTGAGGRYAMLRRCDLALLITPPPKGCLAVGPTQLADFCRWQLECGRRGWTADKLTSMAARWELSETQFRDRRKRLLKTGVPFLTVAPRAGHADLVWLGELYDMHWRTPSVPHALTAERVAEEVAESHQTPSVFPDPTLGQGGAENPDEGGAGNADLGVRKTLIRPPRESLVPYKELLTGGSLADDLAGLGGASATPLNSVTRKLDDAEPQAAPRPTTESEVGERERWLLASRLLASQSRLASAAPRWRSGMLATIGRALDQGLDPAHLARALQRVVDAGEVEAHCEVVRAAVKQAWADQRAGMCADCGADPGQHRVGCPSRAADVEAAGEDEVEIRRLIVASLAEARLTATSVRPGELAPDARPGVDLLLDPLQPYLDLAVAGGVVAPDAGAAPEVVVEWLTGQIAVRLVDVDVEDVSGRRRALDRSVAWWARQLPAEQHQAVELAAAQLHGALSIWARRAS